MGSVRSLREAIEAASGKLHANRKISLHRNNKLAFIA